MTVVLGIDGGGSKTHAVVADEAGTVLGLAARGPSNWEEVGLPRTADTLDRVVREALGDAGVPSSDLAASVFGLSGVDWPSDELRIRTVLAPMQLGGPLEVVNDAFVALRAGTRRPSGIVVIAGTGSVVAGRNEAGDVFRTLGLGAYFGDYGGGSDLSESAVLAVCEAYLGKGPQTTLTDALCRHERVGSVPELLEKISREQDDLPYVAREIIEAAEAGDEVARALLERAGREHARNVILVARHLEMTDEPFEMVLAGGLFRADIPFMVDPLVTDVRAVAPLAVPVRSTLPPVMGAAEMALELAGVPVSESVALRLSAGMDESLLAPPPQRF